jgi:hypothetical protein
VLGSHRFRDHLSDNFMHSVHNSRHRYRTGCLQASIGRCIINSFTRFCAIPHPMRDDTNDTAGYAALCHSFRHPAGAPPLPHRRQGRNRYRTFCRYPSYPGLLPG